jgi:hypothetical protein
MKKVLTGFVCLLALAFGLGWFSWSGAAPVYPETSEVRAIELRQRMRNSGEHDAIVIKYGKPYVLELDHRIGRDRGSIVFFGAAHTNDPADPQLAAIETKWSAFKPTVALYEGRRNGYFIGPLYRLGGISEPEVVHRLARRDGVRMVSLEPSYEDEVATLLRKWTPEEVALYFTMRVYWSEAGGKADEKLALHLLEKRTNTPALANSIKSIADIDRVWKQHYPQYGEWRTRTSEPEEGTWRELSEASRRVRGEHMARTLIDLARKGERAFAVVGSGHVIRTEWMLRDAFGAAPAEDQPKS